MSTVSGGLYIFFLLIFFLVKNIKKWCRVCKNTQPINQVGPFESADIVEAQIEMAETGHWPRAEDPGRKSILEACYVELV